MTIIEEIPLAIARDWPYFFSIVPVADMFVDGSYQRPGRKFKEVFDPFLVQTLTLSDRGDNTFAIVDGQRRWLSAQEAQVPALPAIVFVKMTRELEAELFARFQNNRLRIDPYHRWRAMVVAGSKQAKGVERMLKDTGWEFAHKANQPGTLAAVSTVEKMFARDSVATRRALVVLKNVWANEVISGNIIGGLATFISKHDPQDEMLEEKLVMHSPMDVLRMSSALRGGTGHGGGSFGYTARAFFELYSRPRRSKPGEHAS
jgi:hypothetical protein